MVNTPVIDFHTHVGRWGTSHMDDSPEIFLKLMDAAGVEKSCTNCIFYGDARRGNDIVSRFAREHPDRFLPVAYVTPRYPDEMLPELERAFGELGAKFLKIYPTYYQKPVDDPGYFLSLSGVMTEIR